MYNFFCFELSRVKEFISGLGLKIVLHDFSTAFEQMSLFWTSEQMFSGESIAVAIVNIFGAEVYSKVINIPEQLIWKK